TNGRWVGPGRASTTRARKEKLRRFSADTLTLRLTNSDNLHRGNESARVRPEGVAMTTRTATRLAWTLFGVVAAVFALASWLSIAAHHASNVVPIFTMLLTIAGGRAFVRPRRPSNRLCCLMLGTG